MYIYSFHAIPFHSIRTVIPEIGVGHLRGFFSRPFFGSYKKSLVLPGDDPSEFWWWHGRGALGRQMSNEQKTRAPGCG